MLHAHAADTLEPAVLLYTFLPPTDDRLDDTDARVDVHGDGPGTNTVTLRVLVEGRSLSWQLPIAPFVAALPGQPGGSGRMVLLAIVDGEPEQGFWAQPVDCERLSAELQLPVGELVEALRGRLTPWLADDLETLLHDDAHDHAVDLSPAQTLASAVLAQYSADLGADHSMTQLVRAMGLAPEDFQVELGRRLSLALAAACKAAGAVNTQAVLDQTGPFETEVLRLLTELPAALERSTQHPATTVSQLLLAGPDLEETARASVSVIVRLARASFGKDVAADELLQRLNMVDDAGLARLASLWVDLAAATAGDPTDAGATSAAVRRIAAGVAGAGGPGAQWLRDTALDVAAVSVEVAGRTRDRLVEPLERVRRLADVDFAIGQALDVVTAADALGACIELARYAHAREGVGAVAWLPLPAPPAAAAVGMSLAAGLDAGIAVDLFDQLIDGDVSAPELLDAFVCATAQVLAELDPTGDAATRRIQVAELLSALPGGPKGWRWLMVLCLRLAPAHDPNAPDLSGFLSGEPAGDPDRAATRIGRPGVLSGGVRCLQALGETLGASANVSAEEVLGSIFPGALLEHDLLRRLG